MLNMIKLIPDYTSTMFYVLMLFTLVYVGFSIILTKQAKYKRVKFYWGSWLPIANLWILGKVIKKFSIGKRTFGSAEYRLVTSSVVFIITANIPVVGILVGVAYMILVISCMLEFASRLIIDHSID